MDGATPAIESNLFWMNASGDVYSPDGSCTGSWALTSIFADPLFCDPAADVYSVSHGSPALGPGGPYGAFSTPGCPGATGTSRVTRP